ncbi:RIP metalloprotease RseP [Candidatus Falkowbacteria bacterium]|nr:RIP metalloprotease RseP [Candidatus Falkowbacteria bacterium]
MLLTIIIFLLVLSLLVLVHEFGHFWTARRFGMKPDEFGLGFPPRAYGIYKTASGKWKKVRGNKEVKDAVDTIYSVNWIPLGGFVKLNEDESSSDDPHHFINKKIWQRIVVVSAGVIMNILLAIVLISFGLMIGMPQSLDGLDKNAVITERKIQIIQVMDPSPAKQAGLAVGDAILKIDGREFADYPSIQKYVDENKSKELTYEINHAGETKEVKIKPEVRVETGKGGIGVALTETGLVKYPWYQAIWQGTKQTFILAWVILAAFYELIKGIFIGNGVSADVAGPVGIASLTGQVARMGFVYLLQFTALLSINLAIINFLPIPALDGGRVLFLIIEKVKKKPVRRELEAVIHNIGFLLLMILIVLVTLHDILNIARVQQILQIIKGWF